jgi:hypothetical protein
MSDEIYRPWEQREAEYGHEPHEEDHVPAQTTPQGTLALTVDQGIEERDINIPAVIKWLGGLLAVCVATQIFLWGIFGLLENLEKSRDRIPSALFLSHPDPPAPRLLPNPALAREHPTQALPGPIEYHQEQKEIENEGLIRAGLLDPETRLPVIPGRASQQLGVPQGRQTPTLGTASPLADAMPSDSSGGISMEDRLR